MVLSFALLVLVVTDLVEDGSDSGDFLWAGGGVLIVGDGLCGVKGGGGE